VVVTERLLTLEQRERRRLGRLFAIFGPLVPITLVASTVNATYVNVPAVTVISVLFLAASAWGIRRAFEVKSFIEVNHAARTCVITEGGKRGQVQPLESLAPLTVTLTKWTPKRNPYTTSTSGHYVVGSPVRGVSSRGPKPTYIIHPAGRRELALFEFRTADRARRKLEELAAAWGIASQAHGGDVRPADALDKTLHERLSTEPGLSKPIALDPQWGVELKRLAPGYALTFTRPSATRFIPVIVSLVVVLAGAGVLYQLDMLDAAFAPSEDLVLSVVAITLMVFLALPLVNAVIAYLRTRPRPLLVTPAGVSLGRSTLAFDQIEEVSWVLDVTILGDRKKLRIPGSWFPAEAGPILVREIKRVIAETAPLAASHHR
jgi:hypothetical protein